MAPAPQGVGVFFVGENMIFDYFFTIFVIELRNT